jgi:hypothetical protein
MKLFIKLVGVFIVCFVFSFLFWGSYKNIPFHVDEYYFIKKTGLFELFLQGNFKDKQWQEINFNQPRMGPYLYGVTLHLQGINNLDNYFSEINFNSKEVNQRPWWISMFWKRPSTFPEELNPFLELVFYCRKTAFIFSLGSMVLIFFFLSQDSFFAAVSSVLLLFANPLMWYYSRAAMTDSFQLFFLLANLFLCNLLMKKILTEKNKQGLLLSAMVGVNSVFAVGVKVSGILSLVYFTALTVILMLMKFHRVIYSAAYEHKSLLKNFLIVFLVFLPLFIFINPQLHQQPVRSLVKMFTSRWQSAIDYQQTTGGAVESRSSALGLIFSRLLLPGNNAGNFGLIPFIPLDLIFLLGGFILLARKIIIKFKKQKLFNFELSLVLWFTLTFFSLTFYLKNDWLRYYLPLAVSISLIQGYFLGKVLKKLFETYKDYF